MIDVSAAGSRGSENVISSQPTHLRGQRQRDQPARARPGRGEVVGADRQPERQAHGGGDEGHLEQRPRRAAEVHRPLALHEQIGGVGEPGGDPEQRAARRVRPVGAVLQRAGHEQHPAADRRQRDQDAARDRLAEQRQCEERHDDDLQVAQHGRQPRADVADRVVPDHDVDREQHARGGRQPALARRTRPVAAVLGPGERAQYGQRVRATPEGGGGGGDVGEVDEDRREGDDERAEHAGEDGAVAHAGTHAATGAVTRRCRPCRRGGSRAGSRRGRWRRCPRR